MFEYLLPDGTALPENEVIKLAVQKGLTPDDYVKKNKLTLRPKQKKAEVKKEVTKPVAVEKPVVKKPVVEKVKPVIKEKEPVVSAFPETPGLDILGVKKMASAKPAVKPVESIKPKQKLISIEEAKKQQEDIDTANKAKNVDFLDSLKANFDTGLLTAFQGVQDLPVNATEWAVSLTNPILNALGQEELAVDNIVKAFKLENPDAKDLSKRIKKANTILQAFNDKNGGDPLAAIQNKNYLGAAKMVAGGTVQALPLMGAALLGGGATGAAAVIAGLSTSMKQTRLREEQPEMELANRVTNAGVTGIMEGFLGQMFAGASGAAVKRIIGETGIKVGSKTVSRGIVNSLSTAVEKSPFIGLLGEVAEESTVELGEQLTDMASGIRKELDIKAITNSGIIATGMGGINTTSVYGAKGYMKANEYTQVKKINKEVNSLSKELSNPYASDSDKAIISSRIDRLVSENRKLVGSSLEKVDALPSNIKTELNDINTTIDDLQIKFDDLQENTDLTPEVKLAMAQEIKFNAQELNNRKGKIIEGNYINDDFNKLPETERNNFKIQAEQALQNEAKAEDIEVTKFKPEEINAKALDIYNYQIRVENYNKEIGKLEEFVPKFEPLQLEKGFGNKQMVEIFETPEAMQEAYNKYHIENELEGEPTDITAEPGFIAPNGQIIVNKAIASNVKEGQTIGRHEILHKILKSSFTDKVQGEILKNKFLSTLSNKERSIVENRIKERGYTEEQLANAPDEYMTQFFEAVANKEIKFSDATFTNMWKTALRPVYKALGFEKLNFTSGFDVYNFIKDYHKTTVKGNLLDRAVTLAKQGEQVTGKQAFSKTESEKLKEDLAQLVEDEYDFDPDEYENQKKNLESKIKLAVKKEAEAPAIEKPIKEKAVSTEEDEVKDIIRSEKGAIASDKVQKIYEERGENGAGEIIKLFKPITRKIANKRRDAPGFNEDDLISEIENGAGGLFDLIRKYDLTKGVPLAAYINKNLPLRAITASRRVLDKKFTSDVEAEVNVRATETTDQGLTINIPEKPKYKNALEAKVIEPETFKAIENKIISTVRLLKSRMDAPVTLNRTVTPIIAEIRDEIGKQLDIDIKTMLGGKKDGVLRKELLRTKRYILENMTTTWLMGKDGQGGIPQAIQKRIDGKYVNFPDWVGQKIDREAMSTDLAGRTSGAELVRRLPNVFNNVSDVDFLAQIIGPDGNPIRGRKESVSKAMAEEIAFDIIKADIEKEGPIYEALKANQERQGVVINESFGNEFARQSDRGNIKLSLTSKRDLKWEDDGVIGVKTGFKVGDEDFNIYLTSIGYQGLPDKVTDTLYDLIDRTGLNEDLVLNSLDGQSMNLQFAKGEEDYDISGTAKGKAGEILSIVINGTIDYAKANDTKSFIFVASEPSRVRLYNTISKLIANKLGWFEANEKGVYIVSKIFPTGKEANWDNMPSIIQNMVNKVDKPYDKNAADIKFSKTISKNFNKILEDNVGVKVEEEFSDIVAKRTGAAIGKYRFFVPPSAADLELLIYDFLGYGKAGEKQQKFFNKVLFEPYAEGIAKIDAAKQSIKTDYKALLKSYPKVSKELGKLTPDGNFTYDQALRVSMWAKAGIDVPGLLKEDVTKLNNFVNKNAELSAFRDGLIATGRQEKGWVEPSEYWDSETIVSDLHNITEKVGRQTYLKEFKENSEEMFSKENLNKIETIYGSNFRDALEDSVYSMINGTNREGGAGRINAAWLNWINNSTGAIMFWNTRSAVLQTIGAINYLNWRDNNPLNAAKAFANQPQYWKDFAYIWNSDKMKERRSGLKEDVSSAEIANAAAGTTSKANAVISYLLKKGFLPTQIGDSFAIASGGAAFYRNRINYNIKQGMSEVEAEEAAWKEFLKVTDQTQQSGDPRDVSQQQRSAAGRLVLAFQNTSMQQARLVKKAGLDLINNRGDAKTNISKIVYYTAVQNIIFGALQSALFATIFSSDSDEEKEKKKQTLEDKWLNIGNNIVDTILRGSGMAGAVVATLKNVYLKYNDENKKGFKAEYAKVLTEAANIAPPLGSKFTKMMGAMNTREFEKDVIAKRGWDVIQNGRLSLSPSYSVLGKTAEAATNLPLDRFVTKVNNLSEALDSRNKSWQRIALAIGYSPYVVGVKNEEADIIKAEAKEERKIAGKEKAAETRKINKEKLRNMPSEERRALREKKREEKRKLREKKRNTYK